MTLIQEERRPRRNGDHGLHRTNLLAAAETAAVLRVFAQQTGPEGSVMFFYDKDAVRIHYGEAGSGLPLLLFTGGD